MREDSRLEQHISYLLRVDEFFVAYWDCLDSVRREEFVKLNGAIEDAWGQDETIIEVHRKAHERTKRFFLKIQEKEFEYSRIPFDWHAFVQSAEEKKGLYGYSLELLQNFLATQPRRQDISLYGGIKPDHSIDRKIGIKRTGHAVRENVTDLWDIVRFRIVAPDLNSLLEIGTSFWEVFFDGMIRCRNYYYRPKYGHVDDPYRAIHFEVEPVKGRMIEVQLVSRLREIISLLDHSFFFKRLNAFIDEQHEDWLVRHMWKANILDAASIDGYLYTSMKSVTPNNPD